MGWRKAGARKPREGCYHEFVPQEPHVGHPVVDLWQHGLEILHGDTARHTKQESGCGEACG